MSASKSTSKNERTPAKPANHKMINNRVLKLILKISESYIRGGTTFELSQPRVLRLGSSEELGAIVVHFVAV